MVFLLQEGEWLGQGQVDLCEYDQALVYFTRWKVSSLTEGKISAIQEVELQGSPEKTVNQYQFLKVEENTFLVELENEFFGKISGKGIISESAIAWEFHGNELAFEGFEIFQPKGDGTYESRAEYASEGEPHSVISGLLWKKDA